MVREESHDSRLAAMYREMIDRPKSTTPHQRTYPQGSRPSQLSFIFLQRWQVRSKAFRLPLRVLDWEEMEEVEDVGEVTVLPFIAEALVVTVLVVAIEEEAADVVAVPCDFACCSSCLVLQSSIH